MKYKKLINIKIIQDFIKQMNLTKSDFCKMAKISQRIFNKILKNQNNFRIVALFKIARLLKIQVYQLFN